ncbi:PaaI family thioesterase [Streptomyces sp. NPDC005349]|uniref:PaaI family thioesterase n=1 Tax=Streptomyces sp. NPDC005349 TaxID=3157037 RepID=UPI0033BC5765
MAGETGSCPDDTKVARGIDGQWVEADFTEPPRTTGGVALCGACRHSGRCRLGVRSEHLRDDGVARFEVTCPRDQEGGPEVAHGGWTAAVLDECCGHVPLLHHVLSVTAELSISFVKPVPVERPLEVLARVERRQGSRWYISAEMLLPPTGAVLARASGIWVSRDQGHFARHQKWLREQDLTAEVH